MGEAQHYRAPAPCWDRSVTTLMINVAEALTYMNLIGQFSSVGGNLSDFRANSGSRL
jgi:hypothetical protein